jgi:hypothetical protein
MKLRIRSTGATAAVLLLGVFAAASACSPQTATETSESRRRAEPRNYNLTIHSYNYTDTGIGSFEVNGAGGGNVEVSTLTAGGGKSTCCATVYGAIYQTDPFTIKWSRDGDIWCEAKVMLEPRIPPDPVNFEVHFYRDGHIELAATDDYSEPRLKLDRLHANSRHKDKRMNVDNDNQFARCKLGYN